MSSFHSNGQLDDALSQVQLPMGDPGEAEAPAQYRTRREIKEAQRREAAEDRLRQRELDAATRQLEDQRRADRFLRAREEDRAQRQAERSATEAEWADSRAMILEAIMESGQLTARGGGLTPSSLDRIVRLFAQQLADQWPVHGGQTIDESLSDYIHVAVSALFQGVDLESGDWDRQVAGGEVQRMTDIYLVAEGTANFVRNHVLELAQPHFSFAPYGSWDLREVEQSLIRLIRDLGQEMAAQRDLERKIDEAGKSLESWQELHPAPVPSPYGASAPGAELWCRDWLTHMGLQNATVTQQSGDGGIDVASPTHIVQVKHYVGSVSIAEIRELVGVAAVDGRKPIFMTSGKFPEQAEGFADHAGMLLFAYDVVTGAVHGDTEASRIALRTGLLPHN